MPRTRTSGSVGLWTLFLAFALAGCNSYPYSPYAPYGPYTVPPSNQYYPPPGSMPVPQGNNYLPQSEPTPIPPANNTYGNPSALGNPNTGTEILPSSPEKDPFYSPNSGGSSGINQPVPNPADQFNSGEGELDPFGSSSSSIYRPNQQLPNELNSATREPLPFNEQGQTRNVLQASAELDLFQEKPEYFDYDTANYRWLKGVINFENNSWNIIYDVIPDHTDRYQGSLTVQAHPQLRQVGQAVHLQGYLDPSQKDALGKPVYVIQNITRLQ